MAMFHDGDLASGISLAISQSKVVALLVRAPEDSAAEEAYDSRIWEEYWLQNLDTTWEELQGPPFGERIRDKAVLLRIDAGSREAAFLSAFCPVEVAPTFVVIKDGRVLDKIERGVTRESFVYRVSKAVGLEVPETRLRSGEVQQQPEPVSHEDQTPAEASPANSTNETSSTEALPANPTSNETLPIVPADAPSNSTSQLQSIMQDRAKRLEADKAARDAEEKAARVEKAKARRRELEEAVKAREGGSKAPADASNPKDSARGDWIRQQHQRKLEAKEERERILKQIEADKQERKSRQQRSTAQTEDATEPILRTSGAAATASSLANHSGMCSLQIRLFDGSSIRSRFKPDSTLASHVRDWITSSTSSDAGRADTPYTFRHILPPQPSRSFEVSEEHKTLRDLDLLPSATLILVPVVGATEAYANTGGGGLLGYAYRGATGFLSSVGQLLPSLSGTYPEPSEPPSPRVSAQPSEDVQSGPSSAANRVKTLADQQGDKPSEFYNGNSLGFQGRDDDVDSGDKQS